MVSLYDASLVVKDRQLIPGCTGLYRSNMKICPTDLLPSFTALFLFALLLGLPLWFACRFAE